MEYFYKLRKYIVVIIISSLGASCFAKTNGLVMHAMCSDQEPFDLLSDIRQRLNAYKNGKTPVRNLLRHIFDMRYGLSNDSISDNLFSYILQNIVLKEFTSTDAYKDNVNTERIITTPGSELYFHDLPEKLSDAIFEVSLGKQTVEQFKCNLMHHMYDEEAGLDDSSSKLAEQMADKIKSIQNLCRTNLIAEFSNNKNCVDQVQPNLPPRAVWELKKYLSPNDGITTPIYNSRFSSHRLYSSYRLYRIMEYLLYGSCLHNEYLSDKNVAYIIDIITDHEFMNTKMYKDKVFLDKVIALNGSVVYFCNLPKEIANMVSDLLTAKQTMERFLCNFIMYRYDGGELSEEQVSDVNAIVSSVVLIKETCFNKINKNYLLEANNNHHFCRHQSRTHICRSDKTTKTRKCVRNGRGNWESKVKWEL